MGIGWMSQVGFPEAGPEMAFSVQEVYQGGLLGWTIVERKERKQDEQKEEVGASLVAQWLRIRLPVQGTRVQALGREAPTCRGATKPVRHNY